MFFFVDELLPDQMPETVHLMPQGIYKLDRIRQFQLSNILRAVLNCLIIQLHIMCPQSLIFLLMKEFFSPELPGQINFVHHVNDHFFAELIFM